MTTKMVTRILDKTKDLPKNDASFLHDCIAQALKHKVKLYPCINWHVAIAGVESCMRKQRRNV